jgi:hypothetical protein
MSKNKQKHARPEEFHRGQVKALKKEIKRKDQRIRALEKELGFSQNKTPNTRRQKQTDPDQCLSCGKGVIKIVDLGERKYSICQLCNERIKINSK